MKHAWMHDEASDKVLKVQDNLRSWRARMRFKKAIIATVATTRCVLEENVCHPDCRVRYCALHCLVLCTASCSALILCRVRYCALH